MEKREEIGVECFQFGEEEEIRNLMSSMLPPPPTEAGNSFTALLELPANQAVRLLHSPAEANPSVFTATQTENSPETTCSIPRDYDSVKHEPIEAELASLYNSCPVVSDPVSSKSTKRKEREKKGKSTAKKNRSVGNESDADKLPYVHVRARRGEATDSHSLAERARREKINARMKLLQDLVPGCSKISGTAMVLDEIINHVQSLQRQVEFLSMRLATVQPRIDINLDSMFCEESGSLMEGNLGGMIPSLWWVDGAVVNGNEEKVWHHPKGLPPTLLQQPPPLWGGEEGSRNFVTPEKSFLSYDSCGNSASNQVKMEL